MIEIEKDIPIPHNQCGRKTARYPLRTMEIGDSFFVSKENGEDITILQRNLSSAARTFIAYNKLKWKFATRQETKEIDGSKLLGVRIWRIQ